MYLKQILLIQRLADVQFRLFTAHLSHSYLTSLAQPPTPVRTKSNTHSNTISELKTLQTEIDTLVAHYDEATRLLATQSVMERVSDTLLKGRIERMEKELDAVERIENTLEGMTGRMIVARDLMVYETSKLDALRQVSSQLKEKLTTTTENQLEIGSSPLRDTELASEMVKLQNLVGIGNAEDGRNFLLKGNRIDKELFESSVQNVTGAIDETHVSFSIG